MARRERTHHLIGLIQKAGLVALVHDDRAVLLGAFLALVDILSAEGGDLMQDRWRHRGMRELTTGARTKNARPTSGAPSPRPEPDQ